MRILTQALVYFRDGVPASAVLLDAPLLHVEINEVFLLFANLAKVVQERPAVYIKRVLHVLQQRTFTRVRDMVINTRVASLGIRNTNGDFILTLPCRNSRNRRFDYSELYKFRLDAAVS